MAEKFMTKAQGKALAEKVKEYVDDNTPSINNYATKNSLNNAGIISKTYTTIITDRVITVSESGWNNPHKRLNTTGRLPKEYLYKVVLDNNTYELPCQLYAYADSSGNLKTVEYIGNVGLYLSDTSGVTEEIYDVPFVIISDLNSENSFDVLTTAAGTYTIEVSRITLEGTQLPNYLLYGNSYSPISVKNNVGSTYACVSIGSNTISNGRGAMAIGYGNTCSGDFSQAFGTKCTASAQSSHADGNATTASALGAHSEGAYTVASGIYSHAEGGYSDDITKATRATGAGAHGEGIGTQANGLGSHSEGYFTIAQGQISHAEGSVTQANGSYSHSEGLQTIAIGSASHSGGALVTLGGVTYYTTAKGNSSFAHGNGAIATANNSVAFGQATNVTQAMGLVGGNQSECGSRAGIAYGNMCKTTVASQVAIGYGNNPQADSIFEVGNGLNASGQPNNGGNTPPTTRQNAFRVTQNGTAIAQTGLQIGNTKITEAQLIALLELLGGTNNG